MSKGIPLTDEDRVEWLNHLRELIQNHLTEGSSLVLACSALKERYREKLAANDKVRFVFLRGTYDQVEPRLKRRKGHYMPVQLLQSQFEALEEPQDAVTVEVTHTPAEIIRLIRRGIGI
ncbi:MAG: gluconokinase [Chloroflexi bacterium CFX2]|nr:gluconokinase [Chloroflexi bacterium CFX2]